MIIYRVAYFNCNKFVISFRDYYFFKVSISLILQYPSRDFVW